MTRHDLMTFKLGAVGVGHWFERLYIGISKTSQIKLAKVASASGFEKKKDQLARLGISKSSYYVVNDEKPLTEEFFSGIDIVHISDPNEYHASQTKQALSDGKITITEKTFGVNKEEFYEVMNYLKKSGMEFKAYLHLHYTNKLLTKRLTGLLADFVPKYGKIKRVSATFFEVENEEDTRRSKWLFSMKSGGLFMDWIHPFEVYSIGAKANRFEMKDVKGYIVNDKYDRLNPTGVAAHMEISGGYFADDAVGIVRMAKGVSEGEGKKSIRFEFESGKCLDLNYINSEIEYTTDKRGSWQLLEKEGGKVIVSEEPKGLNSSDVLVDDILKLCKGERTGLTYSDIELIFGPQWEYQRMIKEKALVSDKSAVESFIKNGNLLKEW